MPNAKIYRRNQEKYKAYQKQWSAEHREQRREQARNRSRRLRDRLVTLKSVPCFDCGLLLPWYVMEFDHLEPAHRTASGYRVCMSALAACSASRLKQETDKCHVVCANCHKERTYFRSVGFVGPVDTPNGQAWDAIIEGKNHRFIRIGGPINSAGEIAMGTANKIVEALNGKDR